MTTQKKGFMAAMLNFFGKKPGEGPLQFAAEMKALTPDDKLEFHQMLVAQGIDCHPPGYIEPK